MLKILLFVAFLFLPQSAAQAQVPPSPGVIFIVAFMYAYNDFDLFLTPESKKLEQTKIGDDTKKNTAPPPSGNVKS